MESWRKSTYSQANGGDCVEVMSADVVMVRDTTDRDGCTLAVPASAWARFIKSVLPARPIPRQRPPWLPPWGS
jgi:hypothetical protein